MGGLDPPTQPPCVCTANESLAPSTRHHWMAGAEPGHGEMYVAHSFIQAAAVFVFSGAVIAPDALISEISFSE